ncbi:uncharacterized protein [Nicotiana sylvestris]|uniref:uncharacterized protein n=1 Tax=Nicotiana sylvestris TaxID=4096 RepID=UPI00388C3F9F
MAKTSKTVLQKEKVSSSSSRSAGDKMPVEPLPHEYVPGPCVLKSKFKVENPPSILGQCLEDVAEMRSALPGEEVAPKLAKDKKRRRASSSDTPKPKKSKTCKSKDDSTALSADVAQKLRDKEEEEEDAGCELVPRKRESVEASKAAGPVVMLHWEAFTKSQDELNRCESDLKRLTEERDVKQKAEKIEQLHEEAETKEAETLGHNGSLARAKKIEELETRLAAELVKAASVAEKEKADVAVVAVYQADAEAANAQVKEISDATQVRLEHDKCQSRRETLKEVHARGFDLTTDIENSKALEAEVEALIFNDDNSDSVSGSESGEDGYKAPGED